MDNIEIVDIKIPEDNNQKLPIGTIMVFVCLMLGIVAFFIYDKFLKKENIERNFNLNTEQITMSYNQVYDLSNVIKLNNLEKSDLKITSNNTNLIYIDNYSLISRENSGEVNISITYKKIVKNLKVTINDGIDRNPKISFTRNKIDLNINYSKSIYDYLNIKNINKEDIEFTSSNPLVAEIINGKIVTLDNDGTTTIKAKYNELEAELKIVVGNKYLYFKEEIFVLEKNKTYFINDYIESLNIELTNIVYKVDDLSILYIEDGKIKTREKSGEAIITATNDELVSKVKFIIE